MTVEYVSVGGSTSNVKFRATYWSTFENEAPTVVRATVNNVAASYHDETGYDYGPSS